MRVRGGVDSTQQLYSGRTLAMTGPVWALAMTRVHVSPRLVVRVSPFFSALDALAKCPGYAISLDSLGEDGCVPSLFMRKLRHGVWGSLGSFYKAIWQTEHRRLNILDVNCTPFLLHSFPWVTVLRTSVMILN